MTVGVVLKIKDGVVIACDSQATGGGGAPYQRSTSKLEQLDNYHGLVMAGAEPVSKLLVYRLRELLQKEQKPDTPKIAEMTYELMASLYREYAKGFGEMKPTELANHVPSQLLIGGWDESRGPQIWAVNSPGLYNPVDEWDAIGSGMFYAGTILKKEFVPGMGMHRGNFLATRAVMEASEMDPYVGGKIRMATIHPKLSTGFSEIPDYAEQRYGPMVEEVARMIREWEEALDS